MPRHLSDFEVLDKVREDDKVYAALDDLIAAIFVHGPDKVRGDTIASVISSRIGYWSEHEVESEGLDGERDEHETHPGAA